MQWKTAIAVARESGGGGDACIGASLVMQGSYMPCGSKFPLFKESLKRAEGLLRGEGKV